MHIVADIGGTKMRVAASDDLKALGEPIIIPTPQDYDEALRSLTNAARSLTVQDAIAGVAAGVAGVIGREKRTILKSEHLPSWAGHAFAEDLERALSTKVRLENDTALVGLGEAAYGAGKGASILAYATVSTGVNGARIVEGSIDGAALGFEVGGQYLSTDQNPATLEQLVSGSAVHEKYGMNPRDLGKDWEGWEELARLTAIGLHNMILHWSPDRVVLGGSMFNEVGISIDRVRAHLSEIMKKFPSIPEIAHAELHDSGGLYGGLALLSKEK